MGIALLNHFQNVSTSGGSYQEILNITKSNPSINIYHTNGSKYSTLFSLDDILDLGVDFDRYRMIKGEIESSATARCTATGGSEKAFVVNGTTINLNKTGTYPLTKNTTLLGIPVYNGTTAFKWCFLATSVSGSSGDKAVANTWSLESRMGITGYNNVTNISLENHTGTLKLYGIPG